MRHHADDASSLRHVKRDGVGLGGGRLRGVGVFILIVCIDRITLEQKSTEEADLPRHPDINHLEGKQFGKRWVPQPLHWIGQQNRKGESSEDKADDQADDDGWFHKLVEFSQRGMN